MSFWRKNRKRIVEIIFPIGIIALFFSQFQFLANNEFVAEAVRSYGYPGLIFASFVGGIIAIPVPVITLTPLFVDLGLSFYLVVFSIVLGMTLGDAFMFALGRCGYHITKNKKGNVAKKMKEYQNRHKAWIPLFVFLWALIMPLPNEVVLLPLGFSGYKLRKIFIPLLAGNALFNILAAHGITNLLKALL